MTRMSIFIRSLTAAALLAATSCGTAVRTGSSSMFLSIDTLAGSRGAASPGQPTSNLASDVLTLITSGGTCTQVNPCPTVFTDTGSATLRLVPKNPTGPAPSSTNDVTITRVHIAYNRTDGRNTPGVDVPFPFDASVTATVPASGSAIVGFELVRIQAKEEPPLVQLVNNRQTIGAAAEITFYGQDRAGNAISATGSLQIEFSNFGDF